MLISLNKWKWLRICLKNYGEKLIYWKDICSRYTLELPQFQCVPTTYVTENKEENFLEIYIIQVSCSLSYLF